MSQNALQSTVMGEYNVGAQGLVAEAADSRMLLGLELATTNSKLLSNQYGVMRQASIGEAQSDQKAIRMQALGVLFQAVGQIGGGLVSAVGTGIGAKQAKGWSAQETACENELAPLEDMEKKFQNQNANPKNIQSFGVEEENLPKGNSAPKFSEENQATLDSILDKRTTQFKSGKFSPDADLTASFDAWTKSLSPEELAQFDTKQLNDPSGTLDNMAIEHIPANTPTMDKIQEQIGNQTKRLTEKANSYSNRAQGALTKWQGYGAAAKEFFSGFMTVGQSIATGFQSGFTYDKTLASNALQVIGMVINNLTQVINNANPMLDGYMMIVQAAQGAAQG
jgi:hypothetical protein